MKKTRNLAETRAYILKIAFREISTKSFHGISVDEIVNKTNLTKGAFYHHFPTKLGLGYAIVDEVLKPMILERWVNPLTAYKNPLDGILKQIQKNIGQATEEDLLYGCPLNNLTQEMAAVDEGFKIRLQQTLSLWIDETKKHIQRAQEQGYLKKETKASDLAKFIVMSYEGFYGLIKGLGDKEAFNALQRSLKQHFDFYSLTQKSPAQKLQTPKSLAHKNNSTNKIKEKKMAIETSYVFQDYKSPVGILKIISKENKLYALVFAKNWSNFKDRFGNLTEKENSITKKTKQQLDQYFSGKRKAFDLPLALEGTDFQNKVWQSLSKIPFGMTRTYKEQAQSIKSEKAVRAVGRTNGINPFCIVLPCHRVIGSNGSLTGYAGGLNIKKTLLKHEGAI